jgi:Zn-finger nucleic acid-binding protein
MIACPICKNEMAERAYDGETINVCATHGVWLDHGELLAITETERHKEHSFWEDLLRQEILPPRDPARQLACPRCDKPMEIDVYHQVSLDWCREHGVFLDRGELEALLNNLRLDPTYVRRMALRLSEGRY